MKQKGNQSHTRGHAGHRVSLGLEGNTIKLVRWGEEQEGYRDVFPGWLVPPSLWDSVVALGTLSPLQYVTHHTGRGVFHFQVTHNPGTFLPFFFLSFFLPLSYSPVDQLFNTFHPSAELPEVSCFKLNTFLLESTGVPRKFLALQMSSLEFWKCTWISPLCFFFIFIISNLIPLSSRFNLFPTVVPYMLTDQNNFKRSEFKAPTRNFNRELM